MNILKHGIYLTVVIGMWVCISDSEANTDTWAAENQTASSGLGADVGPIVVMTRNVYVGADIFRVVNETDPAAILGAILAVYNTTNQTDFAARAEVLADEIEIHLPHVIGLQEVALIRRQSPGDFLNGNPISATEVESDYLQMLMDALEARNLDYRVAVSVDNADIELPLLGAELDDIRLTDRDVTLVRADVAFGNVLSGNYADQVIIDLVGSLINFNRGYTQVDALVNGHVYRVVNTHLDVGSQGAIQALQATELIGRLEQTIPPLILLGDFNSSPLSPLGEAYSLLTNAGYLDIWENRSIDDTDPGYTCCHSETLNDETSEFSSRIDLIRARSGQSTVLQLVDATVTGGNPDLRTDSGLWPSDHGGVVSTIVFDPSAFDADEDGVTNGIDNCLAVVNPAQRDTDIDGFGNYCDADFNQDGATNFLDLGYFKAVFMSDDELADLNGDGFVNFGDFSILTGLFYQQPGPGGLASQLAPDP